MGNWGYFTPISGVIILTGSRAHLVGLWNIFAGRCACQKKGPILHISAYANGAKHHNPLVVNDPG